MNDLEMSELIYHKYENLLTTYTQVMYLKIFVDSNDDNLKELYNNAAKKNNDKLSNSNQNNLDFIDAGFDLYAPNNEGKELLTQGNDLYFYGPNFENKNPVNKLDFKIKCSAKMLKLVHIDKRSKTNEEPNDKPHNRTNDKPDNKTNKKINYISYNTGFYMYPRSSLSKTQLRLANSVGIIDAGYRGNLMAMFDVVNINYENRQNSNTDYIGKAYERYIQICAPGLVPIIVKIVNSIEELGSTTQRGDGGFGSTGK